MATPAVDRRLGSLDIADAEDNAQLRAVISELEGRLSSNPLSIPTESEATTIQQDTYCHKRHHLTEADSTDSDTTAAEYDGKTDVEAGEAEEKITNEEPYHVFTRRKKWQLVLIVSLAGLFSPLSSNIYFPALGAIAQVRGVVQSL